MATALIVLDPESTASAPSRQFQGVKVLERYGSHVMTVEGTDDELDAIAEESSVAGVFEGKVPEKLAEKLSETAQLGIAAWNTRHSEEFRGTKKRRSREGLGWDRFGPDEEI